MAVDVNWRFTYLNKKAEELLGNRPTTWSEKTFGPNIRNRFTAILPGLYRGHDNTGNPGISPISPPCSTAGSKQPFTPAFPACRFFSGIYRRKKKKKDQGERGKIPHPFELALDGIFLADYNGNILDVNSSLCAILASPGTKLLVRTCLPASLATKPPAWKNTTPAKGSRLIERPW